MATDSLQRAKGFGKFLIAIGALGDKPSSPAVWPSHGPETFYRVVFEDDAHFPQGLSSGSICCMFMHDSPGQCSTVTDTATAAQILMEDASVPDSLQNYTCASFNWLQKISGQSLQLAGHRYQRRTSQPTAVISSSKRWGMLGGPAAAVAAGTTC